MFLVINNSLSQSQFTVMKNETIVAMDIVKEIRLTILLKTFMKMSNLCDIDLETLTLESAVHSYPIG